MNLNATINGPICVPNPNGIPSQSPALRGTSYPGFIVGEVSNPNGVVSFGSRRCATTLFGLNTQSDHVPRVVASLQPWALLVRGCLINSGAGLRPAMSGRLARENT